MSKTIVVTGASDGIGAAAARRLAATGNEIVVVGRSREKTRAVADSIDAPHHLVDFTDLDDVRRLAAELLERYPRIDVLANNAGGIFGAERVVTGDGHERTLQVNYLAPYLLTTLLLDRLTASAGTVVNTSSVAHRLYSDLSLENLGRERDYSATKAYGDAKLAQILFTRELDRRHRPVTSTAFHPGVIGTGFAADKGSAMHLLYGTVLGRLLPPAHTGADTLVFLAEGTPGVDYPSGEYFVKRKVARTHPLADDAELARDLWDRTAELLA